MTVATTASSLSAGLATSIVPIGNINPAFLRNVLIHPTGFPLAAATQRRVDHILKKRIAVLEGVSEGIMEVTVEAIHLISLLCVELPNCFRLYDMESGSILLIELLHLCHVIEAVVVITEMLMPTRSASIFCGPEHEVSFDHMVSHFGVKAFQDALMNGREDVCGQQRLNFLLFKTGSKAQFSLDGTAKLEESVAILTVAPFMNNAITICLIGLGDEAFQALQNTAVHSLSKCGQKHMGGKETKRLLRLVDISGVLANELPKSINVSKFLDVVQNSIVFFIQTCGQHSDKDILRRAAVQTGENRHSG